MAEEVYKFRKSRRRKILHALSLIIFVLFVQSATTYSALNVFLSLPESWTGINDDSDIERDAHRGTIYMINRQIAAEPEKTIPDVLTELQPHFGFPLAYITTSNDLTDDVKQQLQTYNIAYDDDDDHIYAPLADSGYLKLGPLISPDINDADTSAMFILLALLSTFNVMLCFGILYFSFATLWREARSIQLVANQLGEGDFSARVPKIHSEPLKMIGHVINDMAMRIERLLDHSKTMMHAIAHEFRTPLARMRFGLSMLEDSDPCEKAKLYAGMDRDIDELEQLIKISLDYFRMNNKNMPTKLQTVHIKPWAENIIDDLTLLKPKGFELNYDIAQIDSVMDADLAAISFRNLLLNAFKYAHSKVNIRVFKQNDALVFEFDDDGPGIAEQSREEIFSPFVRLDSSKSDDDNGYGVGLSFVRAIAELHHGSAFVLTSPIGGARFIMRFGL